MRTLTGKLEARLCQPKTPVRLIRDDENNKEKDDAPEPEQKEEKDSPKEEEPKEEEKENDDKGAEQPSATRGPGAVQGYAAVYYNEADPGTQYELWSDPQFKAVEQVARGAFSRALKEGDDVRGLFNHEANSLLGRTSSGTLQLSEDETGLRYRISLPDTQVGRDVAELVDRGDITGSSFGFVVEKESWREEEMPDGSRKATRVIESVRLLDVGPVTYPAYSATSAGRSSVGGVCRALGSVEEARDSYRRWKDSQQASLPLEAKLAAIRARAVMVATTLDD